MKRKILFKVLILVSLFLIAARPLQGAEVVETIDNWVMAALLLEGVKWLIRLGKKTRGDPNWADYSFPAKFYAIFLPVAAFVSEPALAWLYVEGYALPSDLNTWARELILVVVNSLGAVLIDRAALGNFVGSLRDRALGRA